MDNETINRFFEGKSSSDKEVILPEWMCHEKEQLDQLRKQRHIINCSILLFKTKLPMKGFSGYYLVCQFLFLIITIHGFSQQNSRVFPGADEKTPSRSEYFSWINNTNEGTTEKQTLSNMEFFCWLHDEYGMVLDIYAFDAGAIDGAGLHSKLP